MLQFDAAYSPAELTQALGSPPLYAVTPPPHQPQSRGWEPCHLFSSQSLPPSIRSWLLDAGSLTRRLLQVSGGEFRVQVIQHGWQRPRFSEAQLLEMPERQWGIVREVALLCHNQPWVFARSVIPASSVTGHLRRLRKFSDSSLGELLFRDISMRRQPFELTCIDGQSEQLPANLRQQQTLWGRRCRFELADKPIMVSEIFLPAFRPY